ncbi:hypothetical protein AMTRI_Chr13g86330 [Amborella trichopoda]
MDIEQLSLTLSLFLSNPNPTIIDPLSLLLSLPSYQGNRTTFPPISTTLTLVFTPTRFFSSLFIYIFMHLQAYSSHHTQDLEDVDSQNSNFSKGHRCSFWSASFTFGQALGGHMTAHRKVISKMNSEEKKKESNECRFYECRICPLRFKSPQALGGHMDARRCHSILKLPHLRAFLPFYR